MEVSSKLSERSLHSRVILSIGMKRAEALSDFKGFLPERPINDDFFIIPGEVKIPHLKYFRQLGAEKEIDESIKNGTSEMTERELEMYKRFKRYKLKKKLGQMKWE